MSVTLVLAAAAAAQNLTICADRPSKANGACTVPAGHWQLEVSAIDWARAKDGASRTDVTSFGNTFAKLGLTDDSDLEVAWTPYISIHVREPGGHDRVSGVGDVLVRYKRRLSGSDAAAQVALIPFVKLPTAAHDLGNGKVEGGIAVPASFAAGPSVTVTIGPEVDVVADADGHGYHGGLTNLVNLGIAATHRLSFSAELWSNMNFDPAGTVRLWSADASAAYLANDRVQLDAGANFGLNRATPDLEFYAGASILF